MQRSAAEGYQQSSLSEQKVDGEVFIQTDVCPKVGDVILDLGCGTGELSAYLAELVGPEGKVIGVDPDKERIQLAKETHNQIENLSFVEGSAINFPGIGAEVYDIVFSNYALHWMGNKQQVFNNMFESLKVGGKVAVQYMSYLPLFDYNAYVLLNPENAERIFRLFHFESKTKIDRYCLLAGFEIIRSFDIHCKGPVFETVQEFLEWQWSTTCGLFDPSLPTEEGLQKYLAPYTDEDGKLSLDFRGKKHEKVTACRLTAVKKDKEHS